VDIDGLLISNILDLRGFIFLVLGFSVGWKFRKWKLERFTDEVEMRLHKLERATDIANERCQALSDFLEKEFEKPALPHKEGSDD